MSRSRSSFGSRPRSRRLRGSSTNSPTTHSPRATPSLKSAARRSQATRTADQRQGLQRVQELAAAGKIKKVLVHEISRVARRNSVAHHFVEALESCGVSLYWHAQGIETLLPNGKRNPAAGIMLALLAEMARAELETLRARIMSGLADARRRGKTLGRPRGTTVPKAEFLQKHRDIIRLLNAGQSVRNTAKIAGKGASTVQRVKAALAGQPVNLGTGFLSQATGPAGPEAGELGACNPVIRPTSSV